MNNRNSYVILVRDIQLPLLAPHLNGSGFFYRILLSRFPGMYGYYMGAHQLH